MTDQPTPDDIADLHEILRRIVVREAPREARARDAAAAIRTFADFRWVGLYDVGVDVVAAIAWTGDEPPAFPVFPRTRGLTAAAIASRTTIVANDVSCDSRYLTAFATTGAEMIVPVVCVAGGVVGTVDVESSRVGAFGPWERALVESCAAILSPLWPS